MKDYDCPDEKYVQILENVVNWSQECQKIADCKSLSRDAKKNFYNVTSFFAEMMYTFHLQTPTQWTGAALYNVLTEIYPNNLLVQKSYYKIVTPILTVFFKYLQSIKVITLSQTEELNEQLKIATPKMIKRVESPDKLALFNNLVSDAAKLGIIPNNTKVFTDFSDEPQDLLDMPLEAFPFKKTERNNPCPCGSGKKYKKCCLHSTLDTNSEKIEPYTSEALENKPEPTFEQWTKLYEIARNIRLLAPWNFLFESNLITIMLPGRREPVFCSVIGNGGECYGVGVYPGFESINRLYRMAETVEDDFHFFLGFEQSCLMCYFGDREELMVKDREVLKSLNLRFRGRNEWIYFRSMEPGYYPWYINSEQADLLIQVLQNFALACTHITNGKLTVNFDEGETLLRFYSPEKQLWLTKAAKTPPIPLVETRLIVDNDPIAQLKKKKRTNVQLEFDTPYLPMPAHADNDSRPSIARLLIMVDKTSGLLLDQYLSRDIDNFATDILDMITCYIEDVGIPRSINIRNDLLRYYIEDFCQKIDIDLIDSQGMPTIDKILKEIFSFMDKKQS